MEWPRVQTWAAEGKLPTLRRLLESGLSAELRGFADSVPDTVWPTLCYGVNPGKLEKYFYVQYLPEASTLRYAPDEMLRGRPFWSYLSDAGRRVILADVPHLPFWKTPGGLHVMGFGAHDNKGGMVTDPPELAAEIRHRFGAHPVGDCERYNKNPRSFARLERDILDGIAAHGELFRWLMQRSPWDVMFAVFSAAHCMGHHFWHRGEAGGPVESAYRAIDREIGSMIERAGPETRILVFAPHGMGTLSHASWNLDEILELLGYGSADSERRETAKPGSQRKGRVNPWRLMRMHLPSRLQYWIKDHLPRSFQDRLVIRWYTNRFRGTTWRAFAVPNNEVVGAVRVGVRGRDVGGLIEPGTEYERVVDGIASALSELRDAESDRPVVRRVVRLHEEFHGDFTEHLPDLAVQWETDFIWSSLRSPRFGRLEIQPQDARSGSHTSNSFLLGTGLGPGGATHLRGATTLDLAASVLRWAGVDPPPHLDGRPIEERVSDEAV